MKSLVLLTTLLLAGCSVEVSHENDNEAFSENSSTVERARTTVEVDLLNDPKASNANQHSQTVVNVVADPSPKSITIPMPQEPQHPDQSIQVTGIGNTVVRGDVHIHHHEHVHIHETPKPTPVRVEVRVEVDDRIGEQERRRRMVERRISSVFPHYRD